MSSATSSGRHTAAASRLSLLRSGVLLLVLLAPLGFAIDYAMHNGHQYVPDRRAPNRPAPGSVIGPHVEEGVPVSVVTRTEAVAPSVVTGTGYENGIAEELVALDPSKDGDIAAFLARNGSAVQRPGPDAQAQLVAALCRLCGHEDVRVRIAALSVLSRVPEGHLLPADAFVSSFGDSDPGVRREAVIGRMRQGVLKHWTAIVPLTADGSPAVRVAVAGALGDVGDPAARSAVAAMLGDADDDVVEAASDAICRRRDPAALAPALSALESKRPRVRLAGVHVLGRIGSRDCMAPVASVLDDQDPAMRREAIRALASFDGEPAIEARVRLERLAFDAARARAERFEALQQLAHTASTPDADAIEAVAVSDADPALRLAAARTLLARRDRRACAALIALLESGSGPRYDGAERDFIRTSAARTLRDAFGTMLGEDDIRSWKKRVADLEARVALAEFRYRPENLSPAR